MARIGFEYEVDIENTDKQGGGGILPHMYARIQAEAIELPATTDNKGTQAAITFELVEPEEFRGRKFWAYWTSVHSDVFQHGAYKYGKPMFDRFARAVDVNVNADTDTDDLLFKTFVVELTIQAGNGINPKTGQPYKDKNQINHFYYTYAAAKEPVPELGIIGDGTGGVKPKPAAAYNNHKPAVNQNTTAAAGGERKTPWGKK